MGEILARLEGVAEEGGFGVGKNPGGSDACGRRAEGGFHGCCLMSLLLLLQKELSSLLAHRAHRNDKGSDGTTSRRASSGIPGTRFRPCHRHCFLRVTGDQVSPFLPIPKSSVLSLQCACLQPMLVVCKRQTSPLCPAACMVLACLLSMKESLSVGFLGMSFQMSLDCTIFDASHDPTRLGLCHSQRQPASITTTIETVS